MNRRFLLAAAVIVVLGMGLATVQILTAATPERTVSAWFEALQQKDGPTARELLLTQNPEQLSTYPLLQDAALTAQTERPRDVEVGSAQGKDTQLWRWANNFDQVDHLYDVPVTYRVGETPISQKITVVHVTEGKPEYRLADGLVTLQVPSTWAPITVDGADLGAEGTTVQAYPGAHGFAVAGNRLLAGQTGTVTPSDLAVSTGAATPVTVDSPSVNPTAEAEVETKLKELVDSCATTTQASPPGCPFRTDNVPYGWTVTWTVEKYPQTDLAVGRGWAGPEVKVVPVANGLVRYRVHNPDPTSDVTVPDGATEFYIVGTVEDHGDGLVLDVR